ncbi:MAG: hypothetical protein J6P47_06615 [Acetobacter sp.]|nr:hypothetical protein [Acetobacter sp.]
MSNEQDTEHEEPFNAEEFNTETFNAGTKRLNKLPICVVIGIVALFGAGIIKTAYDRSQHNSTSTQEDKKQISALSTEEASLAKMPLAGTIGMLTLKNYTPASPHRPLQTISVIRPPNPDAVPLPPQNTVGNTNNNITEITDGYAQQKRQLIEQEKLNQLRLFYESQKASSAIPIAFPRASGSLPTPVQASENDTLQQQLKDLQQKIDSTNINGTNSDQQTQQEKSQKDNKEDNKDKWKNTAKVESPKSPYMLRTGAVIPAILITGINSGLKGFIEAQVSENVYDTATGKFLLIPQGARLFGAYNNAIVYGQKRVLVMWNRITFPDGKTLDIGSMSGTDFAGYSGLKDQVDNHLLRLFGSALLMSAITAGINLSQQGFMGMHGMYGGYGYGMYGMNSSSVLSQSLGQGMGEAMQQLFRRNLNIAPTLKIRPGYVLNVMVSKDLIFSKPYRNFDY